MNYKIKLFLLVIILVIASILRFYNLMHDAPYFFNPDERNMANAISQFRLPKKLSEIPACLTNQLRNDPGSSTTNNCNLNPHFFAYGQFPLYLAYFSDQVFKLMEDKTESILPYQTNRQTYHVKQTDQLKTNGAQAIFWLRFYSAFASTLTVFLVYLITKQIINNHQPQFSILAAILAAFTPGLIQSAHFGTTESLLTFFFLSSIYFSSKLLEISPTPRPGSTESPRSEFGTKVKFLILNSLAIGLSLGTKLTGLFFFAPPFISIMIQIIKLSKKRSWRLKMEALAKVGLIGLLLILGSLLFSVLSSPYNLIALSDFKSAVFGYEADVALGRYEAFYTRQFVSTIPIFFQIEKIFPYAIGWPVFVLGSIGILLTTLKLLLCLILFIIQKVQSSLRQYLGQAKFKVQKSRIKKYLDFDNLDLIGILILGFWIYFIPNSFIFAKWTRFVTPILPFFAIFAGYFLFKTKNHLRLGCWVVGLLVITSVLTGLMFMSIYIHEDSRLQASRWIYQNIPNNSYILSETANVVDIPLGLPDNLNEHSKNYTVISFDFYHMDENPQIYSQLFSYLEESNYIFIPSRRIFANYTRLPKKYPLVAKYYQLLFSGKLGFEKVTEISSFPKIGPWAFPDENAEETFTVFDHPVIRIYKKVRQLDKNDYSLLFNDKNQLQ